MTQSGPVRIHTYASPEAAFLVNSFVLELPTGLIAVDAQFLVSPAREFRAMIDRLGKPLLAAIITHPHPDHFGGTAIALQGLTVPIYATQPTYDGITTTEAAKRAFWTPIYKDEYPPSTRLPNQIIPRDGRLKIGGLDIIVDDLGAGESSDITVIYLPATRDLIVSDLVYTAAHPWLAEGRHEAWLKQLELVKTRYAEARQVFVGHGPNGDLAVLDQQSAYIRYFRDAVAALAKGGEVSAEARSDIIAAMKGRYPGYAMANLIDFNIDGVAKAL